MTASHVDLGVLIAAIAQVGRSAVFIEGGRLRLLRVGSVRYDQAIADGTTWVGTYNSDVGADWLAEDLAACGVAT